MTKQPYVPPTIRQLEGAEREDARALFAWRETARRLAAAFTSAGAGEPSAESIERAAIEMRDTARRLGGRA